MCISQEQEFHLIHLWISRDCEMNLQAHEKNLNVCCINIKKYIPLLGGRWTEMTLMVSTGSKFLCWWHMSAVRPEWLCTCTKSEGDPPWSQPERQEVYQSFLHSSLQQIPWSIIYTSSNSSSTILSCTNSNHTSNPTPPSQKIILWNAVLTFQLPTLMSICSLWLGSSQAPKYAFVPWFLGLCIHLTFLLTYW